MNLLGLPSTSIILTLRRLFAVQLLDDLNEELYKKCVRRINSTQNGAKDAGTKYLEALQAVHQRFADETMQILEDNEDVDERAMKELEAVSLEVSVASTLC